jgi:hypothetical protein
MPETPYGSYVPLTKEQVAGKTLAQILEMFDNEVDETMARLD